MNLEKLRKEKNLTQTEVAEICGLKLPAYNHYENGRREPSIEILRKLATALDCTVDELIGDCDDSKE